MVKRYSWIVLCIHFGIRQIRYMYTVMYTKMAKDSPGFSSITFRAWIAADTVIGGAEAEKQ